MSDGRPQKEKCFLTLRGILSLVVLILTFVMMSILNGAIVDEGVPEVYSGFITLIFSVLPILMILSWVSFCWKWPNIFWLAMPITVATFILLFLYDYIWIPKYKSAVYSEQYTQILKQSDQSWGCADGWSVARIPAISNQKQVFRYVLLSATKGIKPYGLATDLGDGRFEIARHENDNLKDQIRQVLRTCQGEELTLVKNLYFQTPVQ